VTTSSIVTVKLSNKNPQSALKRSHVIQEQAINVSAFPFRPTSTKALLACKALNTIATDVTIFDNCGLEYLIYRLLIIAPKSGFKIILRYV